MKSDGELSAEVANQEYDLVALKALLYFINHAEFRTKYEHGGSYTSVSITFSNKYIRPKERKRVIKNLSLGEQRKLMCYCRDCGHPVYTSCICQNCGADNLDYIRLLPCLPAEERLLHDPKVYRKKEDRTLYKLVNTSRTTEVASSIVHQVRDGN